MRWPCRTSVVIASVAALLLGFAYAGLRAHQRLADELAFADEGRDVRVMGIVDSLPVRLERGQRFEFEVESHEGMIGVPGRLLLGWYGAEIVRPGERWSLTGDEDRTVAMNSGVDFEAWLLERNLRATGSVRMVPPPAASMMADADDRGRALSWWLRELDACRGRAWRGAACLVLRPEALPIPTGHCSTHRIRISSVSGLHITMIAALVGGLAAASRAGVVGVAGAGAGGDRRWRSQRCCTPCWPAGACPRSARSSCR
jgi:competence protein ComEC